MAHASVTNRQRCQRIAETDEARTAWKHAYDEVKRTFEAGGHCEAMRCILKHVPGEAGRGSSGLRLSILHAEAGNVDLAFEQLHRAIDARDPSLVHLAVAPAWDNPRSDPRFDQCLRRMGLKPTPLSG